MQYDRIGQRGRQERGLSTAELFRRDAEIVAAGGLYAEQMIAEFSYVQIHDQYPLLSPHYFDQYREPDFQSFAQKAF